MDRTWLVAANRTRARILAVESPTAAPAEVFDLVNPAGRIHERDLQSDASGRFYGKGEWNQGHVATASEDFNDRETERYVVDLRNYLDHARNEHRFDRLWIVASPGLLGLLRKSFPKPLRDHIDLEVDKDLTTEQPRDILRHVLEARDERARKA